MKTKQVVSIRDFPACFYLRRNGKNGISIQEIVNDFQ